MPDQHQKPVSVLQTTERGGVVLLAYYYRPQITSGVQRAVRIARYLPGYGRPTHVICSSHAGVLQDQNCSYVPNESTELSTRRLTKLIVSKLQRAAPYNEQMNWSVHAVAAAQQVISRHTVSTVISTSPPLGTHFAAFWLKRRYGLKWIADFRDPVLGNPGRARRWARLYDEAVQSALFRNADAIIAVTDAVGEKWRKQYPRWAAKVHVIWNGFDPEEAIGPEPLPERGYRVLAHVGVLYALRHPASLMASFSRLVGRSAINPSEWKIRFVGPVQEMEKFRRDPAVSKLDEIGLIELSGDTVPRVEAIHQTATADVLLLIDIVDLSNIGYTVPAKLYDYILIGRPILCLTDYGSPVHRILSRSGVRNVCIFHADNADQVDQKVLECLSLPAEPLRPSDWFMNHFDGRMQAGYLSKLVDSL